MWIGSEKASEKTVTQLWRRGWPEPQEIDERKKNEEAGGVRLRGVVALLGAIRSRCDTPLSRLLGCCDRRRTVV